MAFQLYVKNTGYIPVEITVPDDDDPRQMQLLDDTLAAVIGTPTGLFSATNDSAATSPHADFAAANLVYSGTPGLWHRKILASKLTLANRTAYFSSGVIYLICEIANGMRRVGTGTFTEIAPMA